MRKTVAFIRSFLIASFMAAGLAACASTSEPTQPLSPLQDAYAVRDSIIIARKGLNDARSYGKISKAAYDSAWASTEEADRIVVAQIKAAHNGQVVKSEIEAAKGKVEEAEAVTK